MIAGPFQPHDFCKSSPLLDDATARRLRENFERECEALAAANGASFIPQPEETLAPNGITTRMRFANASRHPGQEDRRHCNADYGAIALRHVLEAGLGLRSASSG